MADIPVYSTEEFDQGCEVASVDYTATKDPDLRVEQLLEILKDESHSFILVGSSMGGYVSQVASERVNAKAVFLLAPALYIPGYRHQVFSSDQQHIEIVHGWSDEVIPPENSIKFAQDVDCTLHLISGDHRLNGSIEVVEDLFRWFLQTVLAE